ncbi:hypothetical protein RN001_003703 [Aquatica leii]|uniref:Regulatory protein zeste n=1 Tax=Aquatica leii TaxID=1421715 RepID=A0AAN7SKY6_9COLE|nr:hypothetical protein RN001_003703 [Aquatica leii]
MMENSRIRGKNFSENGKNVLFDLVTSKYSDIIDNKKTDGVTLAKKKLAWEEVAVNFNCQNQNGNRSAKQLHDLYDNLKRTARVNLQCDKFTPLPNKYDSSTSYIDPQPSCSSKHTPTACNMVTNTVLTYDVVPSGDLQLVTPDSPLFTEDFPGGGLPSPIKKDDCDDLIVDIVNIKTIFGLVNPCDNEDTEKQISMEDSEPWTETIIMESDTNSISETFNGTGIPTD